MSAFPVRRASLDDLEGLTQLLDAYRVFYDQASDPEAARDFLRARLEQGDSVILLAEQEGRALGFTQLYPLFTTVGLGSIWLLNDLYVAPEARKHGVGGALLEAARGFAQASGALRLTLRTATDNFIAQAVYEAHGWQRDTRFLTYDLPLEGP